MCECQRNLRGKYEDLRMQRSCCKINYPDKACRWLNATVLVNGKNTKNDFYWAEVLQAIAVRVLLI